MSRKYKCGEHVSIINPHSGKLEKGVILSYGSAKNSTYYYVGIENNQLWLSDKSISINTIDIFI